ncbi:receptor like protein 27-like [Lolium rigidum]|uniref:receptor like protein 27-like n=1 Tax=Lolium rigidum TaxID=89674 RepID=UPI001F5C5748|nr:receptor like protein 27-like [Lolium rigidum]
MALANSELDELAMWDGFTIQLHESALAQGRPATPPAMLTRSNDRAPTSAPSTAWAFLEQTQLLHCSHPRPANSGTLHVAAQCPESHAVKLLTVKRSFSFTDVINNEPTAATKTLPSWREGTDCCRWEGIGCDNATGFVTLVDLSNRNLQISRLPSDLFRLASLQYLNLACNTITSSQLPVPGFESLTQLTYLNLSNCNFVGQVPISISRLTNLATLDLGHNPLLKLHRLSNIVASLSKLKELHLDQVNITATASECFNALAKHVPLLQILSLNGCGLSGPIVPSLSTLHSLSVIDLGANCLTGPLPDLFSPSNFPLITVLVLADNIFEPGPFPLGITGLKNLMILDLRATNLVGVIPDSIGNLTSLTKLYLRLNYFSGGLPQILSNLTHLTILDCGYSGLSGRIPWLTSLTHLESVWLDHSSFTGPVPLDGQLYPYLSHVDLSDNSLSGTVPASLFTQPALHELYLHMNNLSGAIEEFQNPSSTLAYVYLNQNQLTGAIPTSASQLAALDTLQLDHNNFTGTLDLNPFLMLRNLSRLSASYNPLLSASGDGNEGHANSSISFLDLSYCNLTRLPGALRYLPRLDCLDLSRNQISGEIPDWIWRNMSNLMLHHNLFTTVEQPMDHVHISIVDLSFNKLRGTVPFPYGGYMLDYSNNKFSSIPSGSFLRQFKSTYSVDLSNNELSGTIPYADCHSHDALQILDLSGNNLSGLVPPYLLKGCNDLEVLNLRGNRLGGTWPDDMDESCNLKLVDLHGNQMEGRLPRSLARCQYLVALDVGGNHFLDSFPSWLAKLPELRLLILRHNKFHGPVSIPALDFGDQTAVGYFSRVQIIDLAGNGFSGDLASDFFKGFGSMVWDPSANGTADYEDTLYASAGRSSYQVAVDVAMKQQYMRVAKVRTDLVVIDLSSNRFSGFIPRSIGNLTSLLVVNLSRNAFAGGIPGELSQLARIESLDLSWNYLTGEIPRGLAMLTSLEWLNLSYNDLSGSIPPGPQFSTFSTSSFQGGNRGLYGCPLPVKCKLAIVLPPPTLPPPVSEASPADLIMLGLFVGAGFGVGFLLSITWQFGFSSRGNKMALQFSE